MSEERQQFRVLYRDFLFRTIDLEVLSRGGDTQNLLIQFVAILAAFNLVLALYVTRQFRRVERSGVPHFEHDGGGGTVCGSGLEQHASRSPGLRDPGAASRANPDYCAG